MTREELKREFWNHSQNRWEVKKILQEFDNPNDAFWLFQDAFWKDLSPRSNGIRERDVKLLTSLSKR